jgi:SpoVK/Ycf46/Vps4 family AAA+-type ATPase
MFEKIFSKKEDLHSTLEQLNQVISHLDVVKNDYNNAIESGRPDKAEKYIPKIAELYDEFNALSLKYLNFLVLQLNPQHGLNELENLESILHGTETFFGALDIESAKAQNLRNFEMYKGLFLFNLKKYRRALRSFDAVLNSDDSISFIWKKKGDCLVELGNLDEALESYENAIELDWNNGSAWAGKGKVLLASEEFSEALDAFETALEIDDSDEDAVQGKAAVLIKINENPSEFPQVDSTQNSQSSSIPESEKEIPDISETTPKPASKRTQGKKVFQKPIETKKDTKPKGFACVAGMQELKDLLTRDVIKPLKNPENYKKFDVSIPNGILLFGPPGCGKTFIVEKLAEEVDYNFKVVPPSKIGSKYIHETSDNIAKVFTEAKDNAPTILFFDEFEALVPKRESLGAEGQFKNEEINEFLTHLNNASKHGILVVGATNQIDLIDRAVMRAGRMDKVILVPPPDLEARKELFRSRLSKIPHSDDIDFIKLAEATEYYSSSDITAIIESAGRIAGDQELDEITADLMMHVIENQKPSITKSQIKSYEEFSHLERK